MDKFTRSEFRLSDKIVKSTYSGLFFKYSKYVVLSDKDLMSWVLITSVLKPTALLTLYKIHLSYLGTYKPKPRLKNMY